MQLLQTLILAGGLATRLRPLTETIPKSLIEVAGKPFILHQLNYLKAQGVLKVCLCIGHLGEMIEDVVGNGSELGLEVSYSYDGDQLIGTGGAINQALPKLEDEFFVLYGDSYLPVNFSDIQKSYIKQNKSALMTILKNNDKWDKSNVLYRDNLLIEYNKLEKKSEMNYIDYGLSIMNKHIFEDYSETKYPFDLSEILHTLSVQKKLANFEVYERFYEIGSINGIKDTEEYIRANPLVIKNT